MKSHLLPLLAAALSVAAFAVPASASEPANGGPEHATKGAHPGHAARVPTQVGRTATQLRQALVAWSSMDHVAVVDMNAHNVQMLYSEQVDTRGTRLTIPAVGVFVVRSSHAPCSITLTFTGAQVGTPGHRGPLVCR